VGFGLLVDQVYAALGISARAVVGQAAEAFPQGLMLAAAVGLILLSVKPLWNKTAAAVFLRKPKTAVPADAGDSASPMADKPDNCCGST
jgi:hypothetical protein